jgi:hypothetical protein
VDLMERKVTYCGCAGETYVEEYPPAEIGWLQILLCVLFHTLHCNDKR